MMTVDARLLFASGIGTVLRNILSRCPTPRAVTTVLSGSERGTQFLEEKFPDAEVIPVGSRVYSVGEQLQMRRFARQGELFWSPHYNIPVLHSGPLMATVHDVLHLIHPRLFGGWHKQAYASGMFGAVAKRAKSIVCVSEFTRGEFQRVTGCDDHKLKVIHNGVDESWFEELVVERPLEEPYLLFVGNIKPHKNLPRLIAAFDRLAPGIPHRLVIVGAEAGLRTVDEEVRKAAARWPDRIVFTGPVSEPTLKAYYRHADAFVFPSYYEGFGLPPLEAMAMGTPVAVARAGSLPEVCGEAAAYFDPFDVEDMAATIRRLIELKGEDRAKWCRQAKDRARGFSWEKSAKLTWEVLFDAGGLL